MSEDVPPYLPSREFVCTRCGRTFEPPADEAEALAELERTFGLPPENASGACEECSGRGVQ